MSKSTLIQNELSNEEIRIIRTYNVYNLYKL